MRIATRGEPGRATTVAGLRTNRRAAPTTPPCLPTRYQPCGKQPAPWTDGRQCVGDHADYDGNASNGCEAAPDTLDGSTIHGQVRANLVPTDDSDTYRFHVADHFQFMCDGQVHVTLTAPSQVSERLVVLRGTKVVATAASADRQPATASIRDPNCGSDDAETLAARVSSIGTDRSDHLSPSRCPVHIENRRSGSHCGAGLPPR